MRTRCLPFAVALALLLPLPSHAGPWRRAYVVDARLSALRESPALDAPARRRLGTTRAVAVVERRTGRDGLEWLRVAVTRRTRGWVLASAVAAPGDRDGERRLRERLDSESGLSRLALARLALDRFPALREEASAAAGDEAEAAAVALSRAVARRLGPLDGTPPETVRALMLSDPALDRYGRLGVAFEADAASRTYRVARVSGAVASPRTRVLADR